MKRSKSTLIKPLQLMNVKDAGSPSPHDCQQAKSLTFSRGELQEIQMQLKTMQVLLRSSVICPLKELNTDFFGELNENNT